MVQDYRTFFVGPSSTGKPIKFRIASKRLAKLAKRENLQTEGREIDVGGRAIRSGRTTFEVVEGLREGENREDVEVEPPFK